MKIIRTVSCILFMCVVLFSFSARAAEETTQAAETVTEAVTEAVTETVTQPAYSGFVKLEKGTYYFDAAGKKYIPEKAGVCIIEGKAYLVSSSGKIKEHNEKKIIQTFGAKKYAVTEDNSLASGLYTYGENTYYLNPKTYEVKTGFIRFLEGKRYFGSNGVMYKGYKKISSDYYFFKSNGIMIKMQWKTTEYGKHYFGIEGKAYKGLYKISGKTYYFTKKGVMKTGWLKTDSGKRYFGSNGVMYTGLKEISKKTYYFGNDGFMVTGWLEFSEGIRRFHLKKGYMLKGKMTVEGNTYYFDKNGYLKGGFIEVDKSKYYFSPETGIMYTGWLETDGESYYFYKNGKMAKSAIVGDSYLLSDGRKAKSNAVALAVAAINKATTKDMKKSEKLKACFNYIINKFSYERDYTNISSLTYNWTDAYAQYAFTNNKGNCYKYASAMAYCAKILGYKAGVGTGVIVANKKKVAHGWTEIEIDGVTYIIDAVRADYSKWNYYKRTYSNYPLPIEKTGYLKIVLS